MANVTSISNCMLWPSILHSVLILVKMLAKKQNLNVPKLAKLTSKAEVIVEDYFELKLPLISAYCYGPVF